MRIVRTITSGIRALVRRREADRDLADEVGHFLAEAQEDLMTRGVSPREARRAVRLRYGDGLTVREEVRRYGWDAWVDTLLSDFRLSFRTMCRSPGFTTVMVLTLGLGIGAATAIFSVVRPVLFEPLGYPQPQRIVSIAGRADDGALEQSTFGTYRELASRSRDFESLAVLKLWQPTLTGGQEPERVEAQSVSAGYLDVLGVRPAMGPGFDADADRPGGGPMVILSDELWRSRFAADPGILGRTVRLDGVGYTIVGVMPRGFENVTAPQARAWALLQYDPFPASFDTREWGHHLGMIGRVRAGVGLEEANRGLDEIANRPLPEFPRPAWATLAAGFSVRRLRDATTAHARPTMLMFMGAVGLLVAITCANLTLLLLSRGANRRSEFAMRSALGAARLRLARYLLTESLVMSALGGLVGIVLARIAVSTLVALSPTSLPRLNAIGLDLTAVAFALGLTTVVGIVFGLAPGLHRSGGLPHGIREAGRSFARRSRTTRRALVVAEVAMAMVLLVGTGLILRSTQRLYSLPLGFDPSELVVLQVHGTGLEDLDTVTHRFFDQALESVRALPGVTSATETSQLPLSGDADVYGVTLADGSRMAGGAGGGPAYRYAVSPRYFHTMGIRVREGRGFTEEDNLEGSPAVAVVSDGLARRFFQDRDPIGHTVQVGPSQPEPYTIVGVVDNVKQASLGAEETEAIYIPSHQWHWADRVRWMVVRVEGEPMAAMPSIRRTIWSVDGNQPVVRAQSMRTVVDRSEAQRRFALLVMSAFALASTTLAVVGLYGVVSGMVEERLPEMGVRAALGAPRERIVALVVGQGMTLTALGVAVGFLGSVAASRAFESLLFQVSTVDPITYASVVVLLAVGAGAASSFPAVRAALADPVRTLQAE